MRDVSDLLLPLLHLPLELLSFYGKDPEIFSVLYFFNLLVKPDNSRRNSIAVLFSELLKIIGSRCVGLLNPFNLLFDFPLVNFVSNILFEKSMVPLSILFWVWF